MTEQKRPEYRLYLDEELVCQSDWPPVAMAAWHRFSRDMLATHHGGELVMLKDGRELGRVNPRIGVGHPWPDPDQPEPAKRDLAKAVLLLAREAGIDAAAVADELGAMGLPTAKGRLDKIRNDDPAKRTTTSDAELIAICYAAVTAMRRR